MTSKARSLWTLLGIVTFASSNGIVVPSVAADAEQAPQQSQPDKNAELAIEPRLNETRLISGQQSLKPIRTVENWKWEHTAGDYRVAVDGNLVAAVVIAHPIR